ncbi:MAG: DUF3857 domain-containing protein [Bacteroidales bacterium]|nr:DUF3857 domain-containing protein [Bacteroidales bacterium]
MKLSRFCISALLFLPVSLWAQTAGEVLFDRQEVIVTSPTDMKYHVNRKVQINNDTGTYLGMFKGYTDAFSSISDFSGKVESGGKVVKKIKKSDIYTVNYTESLADDTKINTYDPEVTLFPYTVEYDYTIVYKKGIIGFPAFSPVMAFDTPVKEGMYHLSVPSDMDIQYTAWTEPMVNHYDKTNEYLWELNDFKPVKKEHNMPSLSGMLPMVKARPVNFKYLGTEGSQADWNSVGRWLGDIMPNDDPLPDDLRETVHRLTDSCPDDLGKIRALYGYLKEKTRYVSIQFGLGGFAPAAPSAVYRKGYGDCKALSYFMKRMLAEAGIESEYFVLNTERSLSSSHPGVGIMDHAMLMVPLQKDTIWMECTNPALPLGYRHDDVAGKKVLLVKSTGGELISVPSYSDSVAVRSSIFNVAIQPDASALVNVHDVFRLEEAEPYVSVRDLKHDELVGRLSKYLAVQSDDKKVVSIADNFQDYAGVDGFIPEVSIDWSYRSRNFGSQNADMILLPSVMRNSWMTTQKSARVHDIVFRSSHSEKNVLNLSIPDGYSVEFLPEPVSLETEFAEYALDYSQNGNVLTVTERLKVKPCRLPPSSYDSYRSFTKSCSKAMQAKIVLKKNANE